MIRRPRPGQRVELHYRPSLRAYTGLHLVAGTVEVVASGGGPINCLVRLADGRRVVVPRGQLFESRRVHGWVADLEKGSIYMGATACS